MNNPNAFVNYNFANAPNPPGIPGDLMSAEQLKYQNMASLRQSLENQDLVSIRRLKNSNAVAAADIKFNEIPESDFKTELIALFREGGRRRKSRKTRRRRHHRKTRRSRK